MIMASPSKPPSESCDRAKSFVETLEKLPLLGLRLKKTSSFRYHARKGISQKSNPSHPAAEVEDAEELECREKSKVARIPATLIRIGSWQLASVHEADLVVKFFFETRQIVWEVLVNGVKNRMEIEWSDISAIRATIEENKPGILEIEVHRPPTFNMEINPRPRHHEDWDKGKDFTSGQAHTYRRHYVEFPSAALDKSYIRLLNSDPHFLELCQSGFPSSVENTFCTLQHSNCNKYPARLAITSPQVPRVLLQNTYPPQVLLQNTYPPVLTRQQRQSYEAAMPQALLWKQSTPPMSVDSRLLGNRGMENSPWDQVSNNSQFEDLLPLHPAAAAGRALYFGEDMFSPYPGEAGVHPVQTPATMRNPQRRLFSDPISSYHPMLPPADHSTFRPCIDFPSAIDSASNPNAIGFRQENDGYTNSNREFIIGPWEQNNAFTSPTGMPSAVGFASNCVAMGVRQEHDGYANSSGQFIMCPPERHGTFTSLIGSPSAVGSTNNSNAMDGFANSNRQLIFSPSVHNGTFTSPIGLYAVGSASHGDAMGVGQEHNPYARTNEQFNFGPSVPEEQIYEQLTPWTRHQAYEQKQHDGSPWK
ncbi:hypothetical protein BT93_H3272 [Corymbia citriodora subsp. variegata]|nr:hypothetical protein BT93_H3272 [Corymbia citriodora subsp. variegata]